MPECVDSTSDWYTVGDLAIQDMSDEKEVTTPTTNHQPHRGSSRPRSAHARSACACSGVGEQAPAPALNRVPLPPPLNLPPLCPLLPLSPPSCRPLTSLPSLPPHPPQTAQPARAAAVDDQDPDAMLRSVTDVNYVPSFHVGDLVKVTKLGSTVLGETAEVTDPNWQGRCAGQHEIQG